MKIIFLSHTPRNYLFKVGSYHLSNTLAEMGHEVLYIPSPLSPFHFLNLPMLGDADYRNVIKSRLQTLGPETDEFNVTSLTPFVLTPFNKGPFDRPEIPLNQWFTFNRVGKKLKKTGFEHADLVIQDKPGLFFMRKFINAGKWIYRATDDYSSMSRGPGPDSIRRLEQKICDFADRVLVTSRPLQELFRERYGAEAAILRNGVDAEHFARQKEPPPDYKSIPEPIVLYVGSLDDRFDLKLLLDTAAQMPDLHFVIVGPGSKEQIPDHMANVTALGPRPYDEIPAFMQHAEVGILPLKLTEANHARSPMKIYEYGLCGLPVVSTPLRELQARQESFISFAGDAESFRERIRSCLENSGRLSNIARNSSKQHSWPSIAQKLLEISRQPKTEIT